MRAALGFAPLTTSLRRFEQPANRCGKTQSRPLPRAEPGTLARTPLRGQHRLHDAQPFVHVLTHKDLHLHPVEARLPHGWSVGEGAWFGASEWPSLGLPAPVRRLLENA